MRAGKSAEKSSKKRCSLDLNVSPREWRPDIPIQPEKRRGKKSNKRRSDPIPINISCDSEDSINKSPMVKENLANMTYWRKVAVFLPLRPTYDTHTL